MNRSTIATLAIITGLVAAMCVTTPAVAQGTFGSLPDPISSRDLERYAERLGLSDQQLRAIANHHGRYLDDFRTLREREIEQFLSNMRELMQDFDLSQRREVEATVRRLNSIMNRIRSLDEQLFDEMQAALTDEQAAVLPRVRLHRERVRYSSEITRGIDFINPAVRVDLAEIINNMDLPPDLLDRIDPMLEVYERRVTAAARRLFDASTNMVLESLKQLERMGFTEGSVSDPRIAFRLFEAFQEIWAEVTADLLKDAADLASLHRSTFRNVAAVLPDDRARELRTAYFRRAYPEAAVVGRSAQRQFDAALNLPDLPDDLIASIESLAASHWQNQSRRADQIADLLDQRRRDLSLRHMVRRDEDERQQKIDEMRELAEKADAAVIESLHAMLGPELAEQVRTARPDPQRMTFRGIGRGPGGPRFAGRIETESEEDRFINRVPSRISDRDVQNMASRLDLNDAQASVLESLHDAYLDRYRNLNDTHITPLREAARELAAFGPRSGGEANEHAAALDRVYELYQSAFEAIQRLDEQFFDDVKVAVADANQHAVVDRLRLQRLRMTYLAGEERQRGRRRGPAGPTFGFSQPAIDLTMLVNEARLDRDAQATANEALADYERQVTEHLRERFEADLQMQQALRRMMAMGGPGGSPDSSPRETDRRGFRDVMRTSGRASQNASRAITSLNHAALDELRDVLPPESMYRLEHAYNRLAYPEVFDDPNAVDSSVTAAMDLPDLGDSQRTRLRELSADYRLQYAQLSQQMLELHKAAAEEALASDERPRPGVRVRGETGNELERLRFDRDELSEKARRQLRAILSDDQLQRVSGL